MTKYVTEAGALQNWSLNKFESCLLNIEIDKYTCNFNLVSHSDSLKMLPKSKGSELYFS